jgi:hypothetical protein
MVRVARRLGLAAALAVALVAAGCSTLRPTGAHGAPADDCERWFERLDAAVDAAGVRDAQDERIAGFAGLRIDRLGVALRDQAAVDDAAFAAWLAHAATLDEAGRAVEIGNLPRKAFPLAENAPDAAAATALSDRCRDERVARWSRAQPGERARVLDAARVPDRYSTPLRALGLYPLVRWPFFAGVTRWQEEHARVMARWAESPPAGLVRFVPPGTPSATEPTWSPDALGVPRASAADAARWLALHAPVFEVETTGAYDAFGAPLWTSSPTPQVDTAQPVVYQRLAYTRVGGRVLAQLVYTLWFPERPRDGGFDLLGGALDGVIVRLTLAPDGRVMMMDTIHACGCYHLFFPAAGVTARPDAPSHNEWAFVPGPLPVLGPGERLVVRIASRTHYVSGLARDDKHPGRVYALRPEDDLRHLPAPGGITRSLYGPDGLVAGSERSERFLFWPMGIASAGAMRQWGHHATAFVGRRHFDDADLLDRRFDFAPPQ